MYSGGNLRSQHATGDYSVDRWTWQEQKWAVYSPEGVCVGLHDRKEDAEREATEFRIKRT